MAKQQRKHYSQMSAAEVGFLTGYVRAHADSFQGLPHYEDRAQQRHFTLTEALDAVSGGKPIEVSKLENGEVRALFRRQSGPNAGTCTVVSLTRRMVVTVFYNDPADQHDTLNYNLYRWNTDVVSLIKSLRGAQ